ncbi:GGDEF domain-containing protein [Shewanella sp. Scap07]|uniref:GGDEF domain-containing protein n=1 Tax=Shewanella sp. Scap07 TaxID=2589987 RepID=UPI0021199DC3|nr:GGDEF domain-containing protein [Shewanella sp. Scap07]
MIFAICLVLLGLSGLLAAIIPTYQMCVLHEQHKGWQLLMSMIAMFIFGYIGFIWLLLHRPTATLEMIVAAVFAGGGIFVWLVTKMSRHTLAKLLQTLHDKDYQANHDLLTGLPNRNRFYTQLDMMLANTSNTFSCIMMDLNEFKIINDTLGHEAGDEVLKEVGKRIAYVCPPQSLSARLGGDEFAVILPNTNSQLASETALKIKQALLQDIQFEQHRLAVGVSIGIAEFPRNGNDRRSLMKSADIAMYHAKNHHTPFTIFGSPVTAK